MAPTATELRVKELLRAKQWTTKILAEKTGLSESYLTHIKNHTRRWNEDILRRLAEAFEVGPTDMLTFRKRLILERKERLQQRSEPVQPVVHAKMVPVMKEIPAHPSPYTNQVTQLTTGCKDQFIPVVGFTDPDMFCVKLDSGVLRPEFNKGHYLIVSPAAEIFSGDLVAVEYSDHGRLHRQFMYISYADGFIVLEAPNHKQAPVALTKAKGVYRLIGKMVLRYQKID